MGTKYIVDEDFFRTWNPSMAYVLGYIYADGSLESSAHVRGKYLRIGSIDKKTIEYIKKVLQSQHAIVTYKDKKCRSSTQYRIRIGNKAIYENLLMYGLHPKKSLDIKFPEVPKEHLGHFIRGVFDGDGCVFLNYENTLKGTRSLKKLTTVFSSGSKNFLSGLKILLSTMYGLTDLKVYRSKRAYQLRYSSADSILLFKTMYADLQVWDYYLQRKYAIFEEYFERRPARVDGKIKKVLMTERAR